MVTIQQIERGITDYAEQELARKATNTNKFLIYFILPNISSKIESYAQKAMDNDLTKCFFDVNGNIDLDKVYENAKSAMARSGEVEAMGIIFKADDVDKLRNYILNA